FVGLELFSVFFFDNDLRLGNLHFKAFPAHVFEEDGNVEFSTAPDIKGISAAAAQVDLQSDVDFQFFFQAFADLAAGDEFPITAGKRRVIDQEFESNRWLIDFDGWKRFLIG